MTNNRLIREYCLRVLRMASKKDVEVIIGQVLAQLIHEQRLKGLSGAINEMINAINHYNR